MPKAVCVWECVLFSTDTRAVAVVDLVAANKKFLYLLDVVTVSVATERCGGHIYTSLTIIYAQQIQEDK